MTHLYNAAELFPSLHSKVTFWTQEKSMKIELKRLGEKKKSPVRKVKRDSDQHFISASTGEFQLF